MPAGATRRQPPGGRCWWRKARRTRRCSGRPCGSRPTSCGCRRRNASCSGGGGYDANAVVAKLSTAKYDAVFFIGRGVEAIQVLSALAETELTPKIYLLSLDAARTLGGGGKVSFAGPAFMAFPLLPGGAPGEDLTEFRQLAQAHQLPRQHEAAQRLALGSAKLLADTLLKLGRTITRESLIEALEQHYRYYGGYVPPLTFGPNRRIGPQGAYVLKVNLATGETVPVTGFLPVD
ncbi:MAG: ABC transporter substrate-binding protein [Thermoanaerobaculia bacterium]|nr:ABC transporter substrate-binding protein [Thermoanaerobaculia bacterium]